MDNIEETSRISSLDLYEDLLVNDSKQNRCVTLQEVNTEKKQLEEQNYLLRQQLLQTVTNFTNLEKKYDVLEENFKSLLETAKRELERKNNVISRLTGGHDIRLKSHQKSNNPSYCIASSKSLSLKGQRVEPNSVFAKSLEDTSNVKAGTKCDDFKQETYNDVTKKSCPLKNISQETPTSQQNSRARNSESCLNEKQHPHSRPSVSETKYTNKKDHKQIRKRSPAAKHNSENHSSFHKDFSHSHSFAKMRYMTRYDNEESSRKKKLVYPDRAYRSHRQKASLSNYGGADLRNKLSSKRSSKVVSSRGHHPQSFSKQPLLRVADSSTDITKQKSLQASPSSCQNYNNNIKFPLEKTVSNPDNKKIPNFPERTASSFKSQEVIQSKSEHKKTRVEKQQLCKSPRKNKNKISFESQQVTKSSSNNNSPKSNVISKHIKYSQDLSSISGNNKNVDQTSQSDLQHEAPRLLISQKSPNIVQSDRLLIEHQTKLTPSTSSNCSLRSEQIVSDYETAAGNKLKVNLANAEPVLQNINQDVYNDKENKEILTKDLQTSLKSDYQQELEKSEIISDKKECVVVNEKFAHSQQNLEEKNVGLPSRKMRRIKRHKIRLNSRQQSKSKSLFSSAKNLENIRPIKKCPQNNDGCAVSLAELKRDSSETSSLDSHHYVSSTKEVVVVDVHHGRKPSYDSLDHCKADYSSHVAERTIATTPTIASTQAPASASPADSNLTLLRRSQRLSLAKNKRLNPGVEHEIPRKVRILSNEFASLSNLTKPQSEKSDCDYLNCGATCKLSGCNISKTPSDPCVAEADSSSRLCDDEAQDKHEVASHKKSQSFLEYYRNAPLQWLLHLAKKRLEQFSCEDKVVISETKCSRQTWLRSLDECQVRRKLNNRWLSEKKLDQPGKSSSEAPSHPVLQSSMASSSWLMYEDSMRKFMKNIMTMVSHEKREAPLLNLG